MTDREELEALLAQHKADGIVREDVTIDLMLPPHVSQSIIEAMVNCMDDAMNLTMETGVFPKGLLEHVDGHEGVAKTLLGEQLLIAAVAWMLIYHTAKGMDDAMLETHVENVAAVYRQNYKLLQLCKLDQEAHDESKPN